MFKLVRSLFKRMQRRQSWIFKMEEKRFCPKCKSEDVRLDQDNLYSAPINWVCNKCEFYNVNFPIKEELKDKK